MNVSHLFASLWELDDRGSVFFDLSHSCVEVKVQKPSQGEGFWTHVCMLIVLVISLIEVD